MLEIFRLLGLHPDSETLSLSQMKEEAKAKIQEQSSGGGQYFNGTTVILNYLRNILAIQMLNISLTVGASSSLNLPCKMS
jgi:hypothetical protein